MQGIHLTDMLQLHQQLHLFFVFFSSTELPPASQKLITFHPGKYLSFGEWRIFKRRKNLRTILHSCTVYTNAHNV